MSEREGALATVVPVAAHIPGGGLASISLPVALRSLLETVEAFVELRSRALLRGTSGAGVGESWLVISWGCGKGTGVETLLLEGAMLSGENGWTASLVVYAWGVSPFGSMCLPAKVMDGG